MEARDDFALLGQPRQPRLDAASLHREALERSSEAHPDSPGGDAERFAAIQAARKTLSDPAARIRHLIEIEKWRPDGVTAERPAHEKWFAELAGVLNPPEPAGGHASTNAARIALAIRLKKIAVVRAELSAEIRALEKEIETHGGPEWKSAPVDWKALAAALAAFQKWERSLRDAEFAARRRLSETGPD